jgi:hypothetical protein
MPQAATLRVDGYRDLLRGLATADRETRLALRATLRHAGDATRAGAVARLSSVDSRSASGFKTRVRQRGVAVEQSLKRTTGQHPEWGSYQMRHALLPALGENADETERRMEAAMDAIAAHFNSGGSVGGPDRH